MEINDLEEIKKAIKDYYYFNNPHESIKWKSEALMNNARRILEKYFIKYSNDFTNELFCEIRTFFRKIDLMRSEKAKIYSSNRRDYLPWKIHENIKNLNSELLELKEKIEKLL